MNEALSQNVPIESMYLVIGKQRKRQNLKEICKEHTDDPSAFVRITCIYLNYCVYDTARSCICIIVPQTKESH